MRHVSALCLFLFIILTNQFLKQAAKKLRATEKGLLLMHWYGCCTSLKTYSHGICETRC